MKKPLAWVAPLLVTLGSSLFAVAPAQEYSPGAPFDIAPFGLREAQADGTAHVIRWAEPRKIRRVVVEFEGGPRVSQPTQIRLQYWHRVWDGTADPLIVERGAGGVGWDAMDDWTNGRWVTVKGQVKQAARSCEFTFAPTSADELSNLKGESVPYRKTLALRVCSDGRMPPPSRLRVFTESVCKSLRVRIQFGEPRDAVFKTGQQETGRVEVFNGRLTAVRPIQGGSVTVRPDLGWVLKDSAKGGIEADLVMAVDPIDGRYDRTIVTVRSSTRPFSFAADEIARGDRLLVDDLGVLVTHADDPISLDVYRDALVREYGGQTVYDRVAASEEQTLSRAWNDMPLKRPVTFVHGLPGNRNTLHQWPNGEIEITSHKRWFDVGKEWIILPGTLQGRQEIVAQYER